MATDNFQTLSDIPGALPARRSPSPPATAWS
jgi:hypothetical protein